MKKGRHRRFEEARALKRTTEGHSRTCPECSAEAGEEHASWCLWEPDEDDLSVILNPDLNPDG